jgi:hypothetical protein
MDLHLTFRVLHGWSNCPSQSGRFGRDQHSLFRGFSQDQPGSGTSVDPISGRCRIVAFRSMTLRHFRRGDFSMQSDERVQRIRAKVEEERKLLGKLERTLISSDLKQLLKPAHHALDDVEGYFLDPKILGHPPRTGAQIIRSKSGRFMGLRLGHPVVIGEFDRLTRLGRRQIADVRVGPFAAVDSINSRIKLALWNEPAGRLDVGRVSRPDPYVEIHGRSGN